MENRAFPNDSTFGNTSITSPYSVKFPFWISIISSESKLVDPFGNSPPYMVQIPAGRSITLPIKFEKDGLFKMLYAKFNALDNRNEFDQFQSRTNGVSLNSSDKVYVNTLQGYAGAYQNFNYLRITMILESIGGRKQEIDLPMATMQGEQSGMCQIRNTALNPQSAVITLKVQNLANWDIYLNGMLFGYKTRIGG